MFKQNRKGGFTLVEVLIVIIIVGILIAALLPRLTGSQERARDTARAAMVNQIANGVALFINDAGTLGSQGAICADDTSVVTGDVNGTSTDLGDYMTNMPSDPQSSYVNETCTGSAYIYVSDFNGANSTAGQAAFIYADLEGTVAANVADPALTDGATTEEILQTLVEAGGTAGFGVLVR